MLRSDRFFKRLFDLFFAVLGLVLTWWIILISFILASFDTGQNGFFTQFRVGKDGRLFKIIKIRTMRSAFGPETSVTTIKDPRITRLGSFLRKSKVDELPQLFNVLLGHMSFVGPRPDVPGFADKLEYEDRKILSIRPGITGPATVRFRDEEVELSFQADPEKFNKEIIYPEKVRLNRKYVEAYRFMNDLKWIRLTLFPNDDKGCRRTQRTST